MDKSLTISVILVTLIIGITLGFSGGRMTAPGGRMTAPTPQPVTKTVYRTNRVAEIKLQELEKHCVSMNESIEKYRRNSQGAYMAEDIYEALKVTNDGYCDLIRY